MKPMNPLAKDLWIQRLLTEDKIEGHLADTEGVCALGALVECAISAGVPVERVEYASRNNATLYAYLDPADPPDTKHWQTCPPSVLEWAGLDDTRIVADDELIETILDEGGEEYAAMIHANMSLTIDELNDEYPAATFPVIASFIARNL